LQNYLKTCAAKLFVESWAILAGAEENQKLKVKKQKYGAKTNT